VARYKSQLSLLSDHPDQALFVAAFFSGLILIVAFKTIFSGVGAFLALSCAILVICAYAIGALRFRGVRLSADRIGDNCYYLGFLFTLISLSLALYSFTQNSIEARDLVADFGIALGSTITGIFARILIQQMRIETEQIGDEIQKGLTELAVDTSADLQNVIAEVSSLSESFKDTLKSSAEEVALISKKSIKTFERVIASLESHLASSSAKFIEMSDEMGRSASGIAGAFDEARSNIARTQVPVPSDLFSGVSQQVSATGREIANLNAAIVELVSKVQSARESWVKRVENEQLEFPASVFKGFDSVTNELLESVKSLNVELSNLQSARHLKDAELAQRVISIPNDSIERLSASINTGVAELDKLSASLSAANRSVKTLPASADSAPVKRSILSRVFGRR
jgi:uncharacterized protein YoxC